MPWEDPELETDEAGIIERILLGMADRMPGWVPVEGAPEVALAEEIGRETAATNALAVEVARLAIAGIGETVFKLAPRVFSAALLPDVALTLLLSPESTADRVTDDFTQVVTIPAGFTVATETVAFSLPADVVETVTFNRITTGFFDGFFQATLHVALTATTVGTIGNLEAGTSVQILTNTPLVSTAAIAEDGAGGADEETLDDYLDRVADYLSALRPGGVLADDLVALARTVNGVHRAIGFDLYDPDEAGPQERTATVMAIDDDGAPVAGATLTELTATLQAAREVNFNIIVAEPTYTSLAVVATVVAVEGGDVDDIESRVSDAIAAYIDPASWGRTAADPRAWSETTVIRVLNLAVVIAQVAGVASVTGLTINGSATGSALDGPAALPAPITGSVTSSIAVTVDAEDSGGGVYQPDDVAGLLAWYRATDLSALSNGADVTAWPDAAGSNDASAGPGIANAPTYSTVAINGHPAVHFVSSSDQHMLVPAAITGQKPFTAFFVVKAADYAANRGLLAGGGGSLALRLNATTGRPNLDKAGTAGIGTATAGPSANTGAVVCCRYDGSGNYAFFIDGVAAGSGTNDQTFSDSEGAIGEAMNGYIGEVVIYATALSALDRQTVETYLRDTWGTP